MVLRFCSLALDEKSIIFRKWGSKDQVQRVQLEFFSEFEVVYVRRLVSRMRIPQKNTDVNYDTGIIERLLLHAKRPA